jgi:hypothetical protein
MTTYGSSFVSGYPYKRTRSVLDKMSPFSILFVSSLYIYFVYFAFIIKVLTFYKKITPSGREEMIRGPS